VIGDVHADRAVARRRRVDRHAALRGFRDDGIVDARRIPREQILTEAVVQLGRRDRARELRADEKVADVGVGLEQDGRWKQDVVNADDPLFVQLDVVEERRSAMEAEVQRVVEIVIQVRAGADDEVDEAAVHELDHAAAEPRRRERAGDGQPDCRVVVGQQHLLGEDVTRL
jgi:hypothetical protein